MTTIDSIWSSIYSEASKRQDTALASTLSIVTG